MHARPYCHHQRTMENVDKYYGNILSLDLATNERKQEHQQQQQQQHEKEKVLASMGRVYTHCHSRRSIVVELIVIKFVETHTHKH